MSDFRERLWSELVRDHAPALAYPVAAGDRQRRLAITEPRLTVRGRWPALQRRRLAAGLAALAVAIAAVAITATTGTAPSAAYAVTANPNGTISVSIGELTGVVGANEELAKLGVSVEVVPVKPGCPAPEAGIATPSLVATIAHIEGRGVLVKPGLIPVGYTLVLAAKQLDGEVWLGYKLYRGGAPACVPTGNDHGS